MPNPPPGTDRRDLSGIAAQISGTFNNLINRMRGARGNQQTPPPTTPAPPSQGGQSGPNPTAPTPALGQRDFGPLQPLAPRTAYDSAEQTLGPRQYQYPVGANIIVTPRGEQPGLLTPFAQLRNLASLYDVAAMCIGARIEEIQGLDWAIVTKKKKDQVARQADIDEATDFIKSPDRLNSLNAWLGFLLYDLFSIDALTLYKRTDLAGRLYSLDPVDGSTVKPLLDDRGRTLAYQQVLYGYPFSDYARPEADAPDEEMPIYSPNELMYKPRWVRTFTPYGFPPTEWVILRVNTALRKQSFDLAYFAEGNIPDMIVSMPDGVPPDQVQQFEDDFNARLAGNDAARRKAHFVPWNAVFKEAREFQYTTPLDEWLLKVTCAAYGVPPNELGFTMDINKAAALMQAAINERRGLKPLTKWLISSIMEPAIIAFGGKLPAVSLPSTPTRAARNRFDDLRFRWMFGDSGDSLTVAQTDHIYMLDGVTSPDEVRSQRFGDELEGPSPASNLPFTPAGTQPASAAASVIPGLPPGAPGAAPVQKFFRYYGKRINDADWGDYG